VTITHPPEDPALPDRPPTLAHVAELAGVSPATASRVLNGSARVSRSARLQVEAAVERLGYVRRRFIGARSLPVFEAMIAEASQPLPSNQNKLAFENSSSSQVRNK